MTVDHIGFLWHFELKDAGIDPQLFRYIGRLALPLFCWGMVRGYRMTRNKWKYAWRIFLLAIISQIPFSVAFYGGNPWDGMNVCFTLLTWFGVMAIWEQKNFLTEVRKKRLRNHLEWTVKILWIGTIAFLAGKWKIGTVTYGFNMDYGTYGVLMILLLHIFWQQKWDSLASYSLLTGLFYYTNIPLFWEVLVSGNISEFWEVFGLLPNKVNQWRSIFSILLLYFSPLQKYDFRFPFWLRYGFYPGHLFILFILTFFIP